MKLSPALAEHPDFKAILERLESLKSELFVSRKGIVYRAVNTKWTKAIDVVSGKGSLKSNGRWQAKGIGPVSYASATPETALAESLSTARYYQLPIYREFPKALVTITYQFSHVIDLTNGKTRQRLRFSEENITGCDWRKENRRNREALTQAWGRAMSVAQVEAFIVPSAADPKSTNLIAFPANLLKNSEWKLAKEVEWPV